MSADSEIAVLEPTLLGPVNWIGFWTLYSREVRRFLKVHMQTIFAPVVTTLLFFAVFALSLGSNVRMVGPVPFLSFLTPGLMMMAMTQNAFANTSSSLIIAKVQGNIVDVLMPPLSAGELMAGFALGGVTRGLVVGVVTGLAIWPFMPFTLAHPVFALYHGVMAVTMLALLGLIGGIWAEKFDHIAAVTNFIITPLSFLSGTFYSVKSLPEPIQWLARADPFFYMIDGFRYGFTGQNDGGLGVGLAAMLAGNLALGFLAWRMLKTGYKLKA
ncbi:MAG: ABC transporter permease [Rhodospirillaceae bacterium]